MQNSCACVFGLNTGMFLLTDIFNVYLLWEPFPNWIAELLDQKSHATTYWFTASFYTAITFHVTHDVEHGRHF